MVWSAFAAFPFFAESIFDLAEGTADLVSFALPVAPKAASGFVFPVDGASARGGAVVAAASDSAAACRAPDRAASRRVVQTPHRTSDQLLPLDAFRAQSSEGL